MDRKTLEMLALPMGSTSTCVGALRFRCPSGLARVCHVPPATGRIRSF